MRTNNNPKQTLVRAAMTLFVVMLASASVRAQYAAIYANPNSGGRVQIVTDLNDWGNYSDGASFTMAAPGETVYFSFEPETDYEFDRIEYERILEDDVTSLPGGIYFFTMPDVDANTFVNIKVFFKRVTVEVTGVTINEENFPDEHFRKWLLAQSYGKDGVITDAEMAGITKISACACGIEDLTGIQYFTELTELDLSNLEGTHPEESRNKISSIDLSGNTKLIKLNLNNNQLSRINISNNSSLRILDVSNNLLPELDVTSNPGLEILSCSGNQLSALDVTQNALIEQLFCDNNQLASIDVRNHDKMIIFNCYNNQLTTLDVSGCTAMFQLYCYNNKIKGDAMTELVNSLETPPNGGYMVIIDLDSETEENEMTDMQAAAAKAKGWSVEAWLEDDAVPYPYEPDDHQYVDLGLPSGTLWATCNVGAVHPYRSGLYFAWGDTEGHGADVSDGYLFGWEQYKWGLVTGEDTWFTKYCSDSSRGLDGFTDGKYELDLEDDAAYVNWGPQWRMPSKEQFDELRNECTWTRMYLGDVYGYDVEGPNGQSIFLPDTGWRIDDMLLDGGAFWSRSSNPEDVGGAYYLGWNAYEFEHYDWYEYGGRVDGQCVRPVVNTNFIRLADNAENSEAIATASASDDTYDVELDGRTLYKDGEWNTLCLPFDLSSEQLSASPLAGAEIRTMAAASVTGHHVDLTFGGNVSSLTAGTPYIVRWEPDAEVPTIADPVFHGVTLSDELNSFVSADGHVSFIGYYDAFTALPTDDPLIYYLTSGNTLRYTANERVLKACRAYFTFTASDGSSANDFSFDLHFGDGHDSIQDSECGVKDTCGTWFDLSGRRLSGKPMQKGIYVTNGKKVVIQ